LTILELETEGWEEAVNDSPFQNAVLHSLDTSRQIQSLYPNFLLDPAHAKKWRAWDHWVLGEFLDKPLLHSFVLSDDPETKSLAPDITAIHAAYFLG
jgi:hypothetical protein